MRPSRLTIQQLEKNFTQIQCVQLKNCIIQKFQDEFKRSVVLTTMKLYSHECKWQHPVIFLILIATKKMYKSVLTAANCLRMMKDKIFLTLSILTEAAAFALF